MNRLVDGHGLATGTAKVAAYLDTLEEKGYLDRRGAAERAAEN